MLFPVCWLCSIGLAPIFLTTNQKKEKEKKSNNNTNKKKKKNNERKKWLHIIEMCDGCASLEKKHSETFQCVFFKWHIHNVAPHT